MFPGVVPDACHGSPALGYSSTVGVLELAASLVRLTAPEQPSSPLAQAIDVVAGATCLEQAALTKYVAMWLERDSVDAAITVAVRGDPADAHAMSFVISRDSQSASPRRMQSLPDDCAAMHAAVSLAIAVAIDVSVLDGALQSVDPRPATSPPSPPPPATSPPTMVLADEGRAVARPAPTRRRPPARRARIGLFGVAGGSFSSGLLGGFGYGADARLVVRMRRAIDVDLGAGAIWAPSAALAGGRYRSTLGRAEARACGRLIAKRLVVRACAVAGAGGLRVVGTQYDRPRRSVAPWVGIGPAFELVLPASSTWAFAARLDLWIPLIRTNLVALGQQDAVVASRPLPPLGVILALGPFFRLR